MKKNYITLIMAGIISVSALTACSNSAPTNSVTQDKKDTASVAETKQLKDGTYSVSYDKVDTHGWRAYMKIKVSSNKITSVEYDYLNAKGELKTNSDEYTKNDAARPVIEAFPKLDKQLVEKQDSTRVDAITGATVSSGIFKDFAGRLINAAKEGKTDEITVAQTDV